MLLRSAYSRISARLLPGATPGCTAAAAVAASAGVSVGAPTTTPGGRRRVYSSTRRVENYLPMVLESTPRGERAYDIYSRLLRVRFASRCCVCFCVVCLNRGAFYLSVEGKLPSHVGVLTLASCRAANVQHQMRLCPTRTYVLVPLFPCFRHAGAHHLHARTDYRADVVARNGTAAFFGIGRPR